MLGDQLVGTSVNDEDYRYVQDRTKCLCDGPRRMGVMLVFAKFVIYCFVKMLLLVDVK